MASPGFVPSADPGTALVAVTLAVAENRLGSGAMEDDAS